MANARSLLGIISALTAEARAAGADRCPAGEAVPLAGNVLLIRCGIGRARAAQAARDLVEAGAGALLSWGAAAALDRDLHDGDLVLPGTVLSREGRRFQVDDQWRHGVVKILESDRGWHAGDVAETEHVLRDADDKRRLQTRSGALIADMESAAIAETCQHANIRLLVVRAVSDRASMRIPSCALVGVDASGDVALARCLGKLALAPGDLPALLRLARGFRHACASLSSLAQRAGPHFQLPPHAAPASARGSQA